MRHSTILFIVLVLGICLTSSAQVPQKMSYQGMLTTSLGTPVPDGSYSIQFDIYNLPSAGTLRHTETHPAVGVARGAFSVLLGPLPAIFTESLYVEVTALSGPGILVPTTFSPRSELASAPYSLAPWTTSGSSIYYNNTNPKVGIGTSTPIAPLHVVTSMGPALDGAATIENSGTDGNGLVARANNGTGAWAIWGVAYGGGFAGRFDGRGYFSGNVGIGRTNPAYNLDVNGTINATNFLENGLAFTGSQWTTSGSNIYYNSGNVGIGTTTPDANAKLDVNGYAFAKAPVVVYDSAAGSGSSFDITWLNDVRVDNNIVEKQLNNYEFMLKKAGWYRISYCVYLEDVTVNVYGVEVRKNGAVLKRVFWWNANGAWQPSSSMVIQSDGDDLIKLGAYSVASDSFYVHTSSNAHQLSIEYLGAN